MENTLAKSFSFKGNLQRRLHSLSPKYNVCTAFFQSITHVGAGGSFFQEMDHERGSILETDDL